MIDVRVIGAGLAGCEAALQLGRMGFKVDLYEMKPIKKTPAQKLDGICELVCSNSFRSNKPTNAVGLIKDEMLIMGGALMSLALKSQVPAGDCLAVDRMVFSRLVEEAIGQEKNIRLLREEILSLPLDGVPTVLATGPLTSAPLAKDLASFIGKDNFYFYDAIAPIIEAESVDMNHAFFQSRWHEDEGDYINCPMDKEIYEEFAHRLANSKRAKVHGFEEPRYFEGCLPIEVLAERGVDGLRFGPMKPVGLTDPRTKVRPYAVVQLRKEDKYGISYNLVGCQTRMTIDEQREVFGLVPALRKASFLRFGSIHRNSYVDSPRALDENLRLKDRAGRASNIFLAGQITGVEGYVESMATGLIVAHLLASLIRGKPVDRLPVESAMGGLYRHILGHHRANEGCPHVPSNVTWAMIPPVIEKKRLGRMEKRNFLYERAIAAIRGYMVDRSASSSAHSASIDV